MIYPLISAHSLLSAPIKYLEFNKRPGLLSDYPLLLENSKTFRKFISIVSIAAKTKEKYTTVLLLLL